MRSVLLVTTLLVAMAAAQDQTGPDTDPFGINIHLAGDAAIDKLSQAGVVWLRCDFNWNILEPAAKGQFDWTEPDRIVARAQANGQRIFATLASSSCSSGRKERSAAPVATRAALPEGTTG